MPMGVYPRPTLAERFWPKVDKSAGAEGCWPWTAARTAWGHGRILAAPGYVTRAHRVVLLALDGCWRSGASPEQVVTAIAAKQAKNEARTWPDWRTAPLGRAIEHDRSKEQQA